MKNEPTDTLTPFNGAVEIRLFGRNKGTTDWSIAALNDKTWCEPTEASKKAYDALHTIADAEQVSVLLAPRPSSFNAVICQPRELRLCFNAVEPKSETTQVYRGIEADGCSVPVGAAFYIASADCPTIIACSRINGRVIAAHAGRDCLFSRARIETGRMSRRHESVVDAIVEAFENNNTPPAYLDVVSVCGIAARHFPHPATHPVHGEMNRRIVEHFAALGEECVRGGIEKGCLDLHQIIRAQFERHGVPPMSITADAADTYGDLDDNGDFRWWSSARGKTPDEKAKRNGIMVIRRS